MDRIKYEHQNVENEAALLWEDICEGSRIDRFHQKIVPHEKSVLFGYADVTLVVKTAHGVKFPIKLRGLVVKSLKGKPRVDMPADKGADGEYYDHFMPRSEALRTVLTTFIFNDPEVNQAIEAAAGDPQQAEAPASAPTGEEQRPALSADNPFARNAS